MSKFTIEFETVRDNNGVYSVKHLPECGIVETEMPEELATAPAEMVLACAILKLCGLPEDESVAIDFDSEDSVIRLKERV